MTKAPLTLKCPACRIVARPTASGRCPCCKYKLEAEIVGANLAIKRGASLSAERPFVSPYGVVNVKQQLIDAANEVEE
jgi:hypothetical protein